MDLYTSKTCNSTCSLRSPAYMNARAHQHQLPRCTSPPPTKSPIGVACAAATQQSSLCGLNHPKPTRLGTNVAFRPVRQSCPSSASQRGTSVTPRPAIAETLGTIVESPYRDYICVVLAAAGALIWVKLFDLLTAKGMLDQKLSRKLVHTTSGPLFVLTWPLFSAAPAAKFIAAVVPALNMMRLLSVGSGALRDEGLVNSVSRSGDRGELLKGPLYYCVVLIAVAVLCWRDNPAGLICVSLMCGGDGLADIVGRRWGQVKLPYNSSKSYAGSAAMFVGGAAMSIGLVYAFCSLGFFQCLSLSTMLPYIGIVCAAATVVESLPINQVLDDNLSVPLVAAGLGFLLMPSMVPGL